MKEGQNRSETRAGSELERVRTTEKGAYRKRKEAAYLLNGQTIIVLIS